MHAFALSLLCACTGLLLALALRRPARRLAGPGPAFTLWALPVLLAAMPLLPEPAAPAFGHVTRAVLPDLLVLPQAQAAATHGIDHPWFWLWLAGAALVGLRTSLHYLRIHRAARPLPTALAQAVASHVPQRVLTHACMHEQGPAVLWGWPSRLLLPAGFLQDFDAADRAQVLAHERMHLARRDPSWSLLAEIVLAALWFFPPAWWALSRFRLDQELACDAAVLRRTPGEAARYARTLVDHCQGGTSHPVLNTWFSAPQLKERLMMIQHSRSLLHRPLGHAALVILLAGTAWAVHATLPGHGNLSPQAHASVSTTTDAAAHVIQSSRALNPPRYPREAIQKKAEGKVGLLIQVGTDGKPLDVEVERSSGFDRLDQAAARAVAGWRFKPATRHGKPVKSWTREHVVFSLDEAEPAGDGKTAAAETTARTLAFATRQPPRYPPDAIKHHAQGTIVLNVLVDAHGKAEKVAYDPEHSTTDYPSLIQAASAAAMKWTFTPTRKNGKPIEQWVRVPVKFALSAHKTGPAGNGESTRTRSTTPTESGEDAKAPIVLLHPPASAGSSSN